MPVSSYLNEGFACLFCSGFFSGIIDACLVFLRLYNNLDDNVF